MILPLLYLIKEKERDDYAFALWRVTYFYMEITNVNPIYG